MNYARNVDGLYNKDRNVDRIVCRILFIASSLLLNATGDDHF